MSSKNYGTLNSLNLKLMIALSRTTQAVHKRSSEIFKKGGLTTAQFAVLEALYHKGPLNINQIIQSVLSTGGNMTVVINNLEKEALVTRCPSPDDKRSFVIEITEKGRACMREIFPIHLVALEEDFGTLLEDEKHVLISLLKKIKR